MPLFVTSLNSGSNGNCYYAGNDTEAVIIDAGISCRETEIRMDMLGLSIKKVKAIFISHEHTDHIKGVTVLAEKYQLPVYITNITLKHSGLNICAPLCRSFKAYQEVQIGDLFITGFPKKHDAGDPHSFIIRYDGIVAGVFTDIGAACPHVISHFSKCHAAFLETNYDTVLLENGRYPVYLKNRISSGNGHLSNAQALEIFINHRPKFMTHLFLCHLSRENNSPELVRDLFLKHAGNTEIIVASRYGQTAVFAIQKTTDVFIGVKKRHANYKRMQLSLFEEVRQD